MLKRLFNGVGILEDYSQLIAYTDDSMIPVDELGKTMGGKDACSIPHRAAEESSERV